TFASSQTERPRRFPWTYSRRLYTRRRVSSTPQDPRGSVICGDRFPRENVEMADISLRSLSKRFPGDVIAAHDISLDINDGEFMVLVGPSGCGKSTLLRLIAGLEAASEGSIWIGGRDVTTLPPKRRDVAMVFQNYALY